MAMMRSRFDGGKTKRLLYFIPVLLWMAVIFWFSSNNGDRSSLQSGRVSYMVATMVDKTFGLDMSDMERMSFSLGISFMVRKTAHFTEYFVLGLLLYMAVGVNFGSTLDMLDADLRLGKILRLRYFLPVVIVFGYAGTDELHQYFVPDRCCSFRDVLIDTAGGLSAVLIIGIVRYIHKRAAYNKARRSARGMNDENM